MLPKRIPCQMFFVVLEHLVILIKLFLSLSLKTVFRRKTPMGSGHIHRPLPITISAVA